VQGFLGQWSEKRAILQDALGVHYEPKPNTKGTDLDPELYAVARPDASAETEIDNGCQGDKTRSDKVSEPTISKFKGLTLEEIEDRLAARIKKLYDDAAMSDTNVFPDAVEELIELSGAADLDGTPAGQESAWMPVPQGPHPRSP